MWANQRADELTQRTYDIFSQDVIKFSFLPSEETSLLDYFPADFSNDCELLVNSGWHYSPNIWDLGEVDVLILTAHGLDLSQALWELRQGLNPRAIVLVWLWDNHLNYLRNLQTALAADFVFPSHLYASDYLPSPAACLTAHVPACCGQWTCMEAKEYFATFQPIARSGKLLANYVDYPFSERSQVLQRLKEQAPEVEVVLMSPQDRSRYFTKSRRDRFKEWMESKSTLILPVDYDLSTRVFDALLAGQVLVVPEFMADIDVVIPPSVQSDLQILKIPDFDLDTIRQAAREAEALFDAHAEAGVIARHRYAIGQHMIVNRLQFMLGTLQDFVTRQLQIEFVDGALRIADE